MIKLQPYKNFLAKIDHLQIRIRDMEEGIASLKNKDLMDSPDTTRVCWLSIESDAIDQHRAPFPIHNALPFFAEALIEVKAELKKLTDKLEGLLD